MASIIDMPKLSDTMTVGTLVNWLKQEGDVIKSGDLIAEVETDKATMELENFEEGILLKHYVKAGEQVPIGAPIAAVGKKGETAPDVGAKVAPSAPSPLSEEKSGSGKTQLAGALVTASPEASPQVKAPVDTSADGRVKASPLARKMAEHHGVAIKGVKGTGPSGRIVKADILVALEGQLAGIVPGSLNAGAVAQSLVDRSIPVSNMRRAIAQHLLKSKTEIPHFYLMAEVNAEPLMELRDAINKNIADLSPEQGGVKFTVNDFILKATAEALRKVPAVNASWKGEMIEQYGSVHLSFGVALEDGLVTPVIRNAQAKSLREISAEVKLLVQKARSKKLKPEEMTGSTFTVTNLGMYGITCFFGIINPPNAGILSTGAIIKKPVVDASGQVVAGSLMQLGFSGDHRVVDGASGAEFLKALKMLLEKPALLLV